MTSIGRAPQRRILVVEDNPEILLNVRMGLQRSGFEVVTAGDGRAALGPMLREYIISEAMFALGIPTTRSLAVVATGEPVYRENVLPGAVLTRVAASHIRVGTFEYASAQGDLSLTQALADYTMRRHYPEALNAKNPYLAFFQAVAEKQAKLIAQWMHVGFIHGVMNTDNMALSGETIDYGPCAFMDTFDPATVFSSIDHHGRYAFGNQAPVARWNLARLAETVTDADLDRAFAALARREQDGRADPRTRLIDLWSGRRPQAAVKPLHRVSAPVMIQVRLARSASRATGTPSSV